MNGRALYIEIDEYCRAWLRNLIAADLICPGDVVGDILDVRPRDLDRYNQVHAFAGIGIWSGSLRDAGIRDTDHVWTGSCPCQPFSAAGQRGGFADERHLWPAFFHLIKECGPAKIFGEQVASPDGLQWLDLVSSDLEGAHYAIGAADLCAAGIAVAAGETEVGHPTLEWIRGAVQSCPDPFLAAELRDYAAWFDREAGVGPAHIRQRLCWVAYADDAGSQGRLERRNGADQRIARPTSMAGWANPDWIICTDGKARPIESGTFPLAHGQSNRVGRLRAYGNAMHRAKITQFILAAQEAIGDVT